MKSRQAVQNKHRNMNERLTLREIAEPPERASEGKGHKVGSRGGVELDVDTGAQAPLQNRFLHVLGDARASHKPDRYWVSRLLWAVGDGYVLDNHVLGVLETDLAKVDRLLDLVRTSGRHLPNELVHSALRE
jgi:hypothetical protein